MQPAQNAQPSREKITPHLTVKEAAWIIKIDEKFLYTFISHGKGPPCVYYGNLIRIPYASFLEWAQKTPPRPHPKRNHGRRTKPPHPNPKANKPCTA